MAKGDKDVVKKTITKKEVVFELKGFLPEPGRVTRVKELLVRLLLFAPRGFGKSFFADQFPDALVINTDGNLPHYTSPGLIVNNWEVVNPKTEDEVNMAKRSFVNVVNELVRTNGNGFKTLIVDLAEGVYDLCRDAKLAEYGLKHESDAGGFGKGYQLVRDPFNAAIGKLHSLPVNILFLSHETEATKKDRIGREFNYYGCALSDKVATKISGTGYTLRGFWKGSLTDDNTTSKAKRMLSLTPKDDELHVARLTDVNGNAVELDDIELTYENFINVFKDLNDPEKAGSFRNAQIETSKNIKIPKKPTVKKPVIKKPVVKKEEVKTEVEEAPVVVEKEVATKEEPQTEVVKKVKLPKKPKPKVKPVITEDPNVEEPEEKKEVKKTTVKAKDPVEKTTTNENLSSISDEKRKRIEDLKAKYLKKGAK